MRKACRGAELDALFRQRQIESWRDRFPPSGPRPRKCGSSSLRLELDTGVPACRRNKGQAAGASNSTPSSGRNIFLKMTGPLFAFRPASPAISSQRAPLSARRQKNWLNQESGAPLPFGLVGLVFAASAFTRPVSAATWGTAAMGSHPGNPWRMRAAFFTGLMWP